jgi:hypothetical protein
MTRHPTEAEQAEVPRRGGDYREHTVWRWRARCACGWTSPDHWLTREAAEANGRQHARGAEAQERTRGRP